MKKIIILLFLILNFFGSENLNSDFIEPTEENVKLFNSYFENPEIIESRNFIKDSFQNWSKDYFKDFDLKKILKYGEEEQISEDPNSYTKKKALVDLDFIKDTIEENHGARLVLDKWFFDQLDRLIEIAKNKILNSKNEDERLHIIDECIEPLEDKVSKSRGGHFLYKYIIYMENI